MHKLSSNDWQARLALAMVASLAISGCTKSEGNIEQLQNKIGILESENASLKEQLSALKEAIANDKAKQLGDAMSTAGQSSNPATNTAGGASSGQPAAGETKDEPSATTPTASAVSFTDLQDVPTKEMIEDLARLGVFSGVNQEFQPNKPITRGQYVEWLFNAYNAIEPSDKQIRLAPQEAQKFKDTPASNPAYKYVQALANAGYSIGYKDGTFRPDKPLTREEMLGIKVGVDVGKDLDPWRSQMETVWKFSDSKDVDEQFTGYVHQDYYIYGPKGSNIQRAFGKIGTFKPKQPVLRNEAAATLWQMGQFGERDQTFATAALQKRNSGT